MLRFGSVSKAQVIQQSKDQFEKHPDTRNDRSLCDVDDVIRYGMLDRILGFPSNKSFPSHKRVPPNVQEQIAEILKAHVFSSEPTNAAEEISRLISLYFDDPLKRTQTIIANYATLFEPSSGVTISKCDNYSTENFLGMKLVATKNWKAGEVLPLHNMSMTFDSKNSWPLLNEYSVTKSESKKLPNIWLGPCAIANHSCDPNAKYIVTPSKKILIEVTKPIMIGEEIFVSYGHEYFRHECECQQCREKKSNNAVDNTQNQRLRSLPPRAAANKNGEADKNIEECLSTEDKIKIFMIFKKMFKGIDYPNEQRIVLEENEELIASNLKIVTTRRICKKSETNTTVLDRNKTLLRNSSLVAPDLETFEQDSLINLMMLQSNIEETVKLYSQISQLPKDSDHFPLRANILDQIQKISRSSMNILQSYQLGFHDTVHNACDFKKLLQAKEKKMHDKMQNEGIEEGDCEMLETPEEVIHSDTSDSSDEIVPITSEPQALMNETEEIDNVAIPSAEHETLDSNGILPMEVHVEEAQQAEHGDDLPLPNVPEPSKTILSDVVSSEKNPQVPIVSCEADPSKRKRGRKPKNLKQKRLKPASELMQMQMSSSSKANETAPPTVAMDVDVGVANSSFTSATGDRTRPTGILELEQIRDWSSLFSSEVQTTNMMYTQSSSLEEVKKQAKKQSRKHVIKSNERFPCEVDDFVRGALLDSVLGFESSKSFPNYKKIPQAVREYILQLLKLNTFFPNESNVSEALYAILSLYFDDPTGLLPTIIDNYLKLFDFRSGVTVALCNRYSNENYVGMKLIATKNWEVNEFLPLHNFTISLDDNNRWPLLIDYSPSASPKKDELLLWLGPSSIANHSCMANTRFHKLQLGKSVIKVQLRIPTGEEVTGHYNSNAFNPCECLPCFFRVKDPEPIEIDTPRAIRPRIGKINYKPNRQGNLDNGNDLKEFNSFNNEINAFVIYKKMFNGVRYPKEFEEQCEAKEAQFAAQHHIIRSADVFKKMDTYSEQVRQLSQDVITSSSPFMEYEEEEQETLKTLLKLPTECHEAFRLFSHSLTSTRNDDVTHNQFNIMAKLLNVAETSQSMLGIYSRTAHSRNVSDQIFRERVEEKKKTAENQMKQAGVAENNSKMLEKYEQVISDSNMADHQSTPNELGEDNNNSNNGVECATSARKRKQKEVEDVILSKCPKKFHSSFRDVLEQHSKPSLPRRKQSAEKIEIENIVASGVQKKLFKFEISEKKKDEEEIKQALSVSVELFEDGKSAKLVSDNSAIGIESIQSVEEIQDLIQVFQTTISKLNRRQLELMTAERPVDRNN